LTYSKLNVFFIISVMCGYLIVFESVTRAEHSNKRPKGKHGPGPGQNELVKKKSDSENFKDDGDLIVRGAHVPTLLESGKNVSLIISGFLKTLQKESGSII